MVVRLADDGGPLPIGCMRVTEYDDMHVALKAQVTIQFVEALFKSVR